MVNANYDVIHYSVLHMYYNLDEQPGTKIMIPGVLFISSILKFHRLLEPLQSDLPAVPWAWYKSYLRLQGRYFFSHEYSELFGQTKGVLYVFDLGYIPFSLILPVYLSCNKSI